MKFKSGKTYEGLFLSDIHYLLDKKVKNHNHRELFEFLRHLYKMEVRFKRIILVGDIIESWYFSSRRKFKKQRKRFNKLFDRLDRLVEPGGTRIYIVGNHDTSNFQMHLAPNIDMYLRRRGWKICETYTERHFIAVHGHQGQYTHMTWVMSIACLRFLHVLAGLIPNLFHVAEAFYDRHLNHHDPTTSAEEILYYTRLGKYVNQGERILISGHTHDFLCNPELAVINTGDWVKNCTFVIMQSKQLVGVRCIKRRVYRTEFKYPFKGSARKALRESLKN